MQLDEFVNRVRTDIRAAIDAINREYPDMSPTSRDPFVQHARGQVSGLMTAEVLLVERLGEQSQ